MCLAPQKVKLTSRVWIEQKAWTGKLQSTTTATKLWIQKMQKHWVKNKYNPTGTFKNTDYSV